MRRLGSRKRIVFCLLILFINMLLNFTINFYNEVSSPNKHFVQLGIEKISAAPIYYYYDKYSVTGSVSWYASEPYVYSDSGGRSKSGFSQWSIDSETGYFSAYSFSSGGANYVASGQTLIYGGTNESGQHGQDVLL